MDTSLVADTSTSPYRDPADFARRRQVAFHQYRRNLQRVSDVVEAVAEVVGRQHLVDVDL
jgi:hypothetical protein